ncbi:MAG: hypothetical protein MHPSP_004475, partial [Paramarteilia canceri]
NDEARKQMILNKTENIYISQDLIENLVKFTAGMDGTEINEKCRQWCVNALHRYIDQCGSQIELLYEDIDSDIFALKEANIELELYSS